ncbi:MAG: Xaa-Pro aminopeptidase, partial [uncultured Rubrobacteraceae bacterium]
GQHERRANAPRYRRPRARRHGIPPIGLSRAGPGDLPARGRRGRRGIPGRLLDGVRPGKERRPGRRGALLRRTRRYEPRPRAEERRPGPGRRDRPPPRKARRRQLPGRRAAWSGRSLRRRAARPRPDGDTRRPALRGPQTPEDRRGDLPHREDPKGRRGGLRPRSSDTEGIRGRRGRHAPLRRRAPHQRTPALRDRHRAPPARLCRRGHHNRRRGPGGRPSRAGARTAQGERVGNPRHLPHRQDEPLLRRHDPHLRQGRAGRGAAEDVRRRPREPGGGPHDGRARRQRPRCPQKGLRHPARGRIRDAPSRPEAGRAPAKGIYPRHRPRGGVGDTRSAPRLRSRRGARPRRRGHHRARPLLPGDRRRPHRGPRGRHRKRLPQPNELLEGVSGL